MVFARGSFSIALRSITGALSHAVPHIVGSASRALVQIVAPPVEAAHRRAGPAPVDGPKAAVKDVGQRNGMGDDWLNEKATAFLPRTPDERAKTVYNSPGLVVTGASAEHLLAMKMFAGRESDREDVKHLIGVLGIRNPSAAVRIYEQVYAGWQLPERTREKVEHAVADAREERGEPFPELRLENSRTLRAKGRGSRTYEATAKEQSDGGQMVQVTVRDPGAVDEEDPQRGRTLYGEPHPIRTIEAANAAVNAHER